MSEPSNRELTEKVAEIREWLVRIDTKVDHLNEVKRTADEAKSTAEEADRKAIHAMALASENARDITQLTTTIKWAIGIAVSLFVGIGGIVVSIVF